jgi:hypothetical protein
MVRRQVCHGHRTAASVFDAGEMLVLEGLHKSTMRLPFFLRFHSFSPLIPPFPIRVALICISFLGNDGHVASTAHILVNLPSSLVFPTMRIWMVASLRLAPDA